MWSMKKIILTLIFSLLYQPTLWALDLNFSAYYPDCLEAAKGDEQQIVVCLKDEKVRQDERLNLAYQTLQKLLPPDRQASLKEAQRAWIKFRDAYGNYLLGEGEGGVATISRAYWLMQNTANQAGRLEDEVRLYEAGAPQN